MQSKAIAGRFVETSIGSGDLEAIVWGSEEHVRGLFESSGIELEFDREAVEFRSDSVERALAVYETKWGPFMNARETLEPQGRWPVLRADLAGVLERHNSCAGSGLAYSGEYLVVSGRKT